VPQEHQPLFLSPQEVAVMYGVTERTVRRMIASGALEAARLGSKLIRIRRDHAEGLLQPIRADVAS